MSDLTGVLDCCKALNATEKAVLGDVRTDLALLEVASQQRIYNNVNELEKMAAEGASPDVAFQK